MNKHALEILEFDTIKEEVLSYCLTHEGAALINEQEFITDYNELKAFQNRVSDIMRFLQENKSFAIAVLPEVGGAVKKLRVEGAVLDAKELGNIGVFLRDSRTIAKLLKSEYAGEDLRSLITEVPDVTALERTIFASITEDGEVRELPELKRIKGQIRDIHTDINKIAMSYMHDSSKTSWWQSDIYSHKEGRTVLPLKAQHKGKINGIVHEVSSTGATVFIEPIEIVQRNNRLIELENTLKQEIFRILKEVSAKVRESLDFLKSFIEIIAYLDSLYARARYGVLYQCIIPEFNQDVVKLIGAKHPLLGKTAVPIDVTIDGGTRILMITGPNTGGKTVALKTVGLFSALNQFGVPLPVSEGSLLPVFDNVFADIGDEQSISQSLSTFSSHMNTISSILDDATCDSLILLDELGAGTDPEEGAALALAILDFLLDVNATVMCTTHHGSLKHFGFTQEAVMNASLEFDAETFSPTYKVIMGIPGDSHGLDIAKRNGMRNRIVNKAREIIQGKQSDIGSIITALTEQQRILAQKEAEFEEKERNFRENQRAVDLKELRIRQREAELRSGGLGEMKHFMREARKNLENLVRELREQGVSSVETKKVKDFIKSIEAEVDVQEEKVEAEAEKYIQLPDEPLKEGMTVYINSLRREGVLLRKIKKNSWQVETDRLKISVLVSDIKIISKKKNDKFSYNLTLSQEANKNVAQFELDIRGFRLEEAVQALNRQLDLAVLNNMKEFSIIHGMGEGVLQGAVRKVLKKSPVVADFNFAHPDAGGFGKTVVTMK